MSRPKLLDLFCCSGGAGVGYSTAGLDVYGVDRDPQPNYPHPMFQGDALGVLRRLLVGEYVTFTRRWAFGNMSTYDLRLNDFVAVHASPPCQGYTALKAVHGNEWPLLIEPVRVLLDQIGKPYVIENVQGAPVRRDLTLCGEMFGLRVIRHRYFELGGWSTEPPAHIPHRGRVSGWRHGQFYEGPYFAVYGLGGGKGTVKQWQDAMGIHWTSDRRELAEAIPPAYTQFIGERLLEQLPAAEAAA